MDKAELRNIYRKKRLALSDQDFKALNESLLKGFARMSFNNVRYFHFFLSIKKLREPDTGILMEWLAKHHPYLQCVVSRCLPESRVMEHFCDYDANRLVDNKWGIPEPIDGVKLDSEQLDAVLIPLLIFDKHGHRVGYGKGFYDRFLKECRPDCLKIGISLFEPVNEILNVEATDVKLDACITPSKLWLTEDFV